MLAPNLDALPPTISDLISLTPLAVLELASLAAPTFPPLITFFFGTGALRILQLRMS